MIRSVLSVIAGFVVASILMMSLEFANGRVFYPGFAALAAAKDRDAAEQALKEFPGRSPYDDAVLRLRREAMRQVLTEAPVGALLVVVMGYALGSVAGGFVAARLSTKSPLKHGAILGTLLMVAGIGNNLMLPPPAWFWVTTLVGFIPLACVGSKIASAQTSRGSPR